MKYHYGRGSRNGICVEMLPGNYFKISVGCVKTGEEIASAIFDRAELYRLSEFFTKLWELHGTGQVPMLPPLDMGEIE